MIKATYNVLIVLINLVACYCLSFIFFTARFAMSPEAENPMSEQQVLTSLILYGIGVSLLFSIITTLSGWIFAKWLSFAIKSLTAVFLIQFFSLFTLYTIPCFFYVS